MDLKSCTFVHNEMIHNYLLAVTIEDIQCILTILLPLIKIE